MVPISYFIGIFASNFFVGETHDEFDIQYGTSVESEGDTDKFDLLKHIGFRYLANSKDVFVIVVIYFLSLICLVIFCTNQLKKHLFKPNPFHLYLSRVASPLALSENNSVLSSNRSNIDSNFADDYQVSD